MESGFLKPSRLYYQHLSFIKGMFHHRHCSEHPSYTFFICPHALRTNSGSTMPNYSFSGVQHPHVLKEVITSPPP